MQAQESVNFIKG